MSLAREHDPLGNVIIRKIGDAGGPRSDWVADEIDNLIAWAKDAPRCIHRDTSTVGNVGVGLDNLHSFSLPANSLATNGDWLRVTYAGNLATNDNNKRLVTSLDAQTVEDTGLIDIDQGWWRVEGTYTRLSATSVFAEQHIVFGFLSQLDGTAAQSGSSQRHIARNGTLTVSNLTSNAVTVLVQAEATANNDVTQNLSIIELCQQ